MKLENHTFGSLFAALTAEATKVQSLVRCSASPRLAAKFDRQLSALLLTLDSIHKELNE